MIRLVPQLATYLIQKILDPALPPAQRVPLVGIILGFHGPPLHTKRISHPPCTKSTETTWNHDPTSSMHHRGC